MSLPVVFGMVAALFFVFLALNSFSGRKWCAICLSVSLTWFCLLILREFGFDIDETVLAVLLGGSAVGLYYWLDDRLPTRFLVFRLPILLTLFAIGYILAEQRIVSFEVWFILAAVWAGLSVLYLQKTKPAVGKILKRIISCCRDL